MLTFFFVLVLLCERSYGLSVFRFANHYADHMVLQKSPYNAVVWGFGEEGRDVIIEVKGTRYITVVRKNASGDNVWSVVLDKQEPGEPVSIEGTSIVGNRLVTIQINDVLFGNVWLCGGQSNMQFAVNQASTSEDEKKIASTYTNIRFFTSARYYSSVPIREISTANIEQQWTLPSAATVGPFSAVCWMYGRKLYDLYKVPIGLISSNYGGSCVESWSSPETLSVCNATSSFPVTYNNNNVLWNAMISPFLNTTIYGAIWYQGEQNAYKPNGYNCTFPAMINGWRKDWRSGTGGQTDAKFPFGFVQLASLSDDNIPGFPTIRWLQTAGYGYVPNKQQENVFMAVAMDLADDKSPYGSIHPRDKADMAERLVLSARAVIFNESVYWTGPIFDKALVCMSMEGPQSIIVYYKAESVPAQGIEIVNLDGFEVQQSNGSWIEAKVSYATNNKVLLVANGGAVYGLRYAWKQNPCPFKSCAVYSGGSNLPSPPFISYGPFQYVYNSMHDWFIDIEKFKKKISFHKKDVQLCQLQKKKNYKKLLL